MADVPELFVYSRDALARVAPHEVPHVVISITSSPDDRARFPVPATCRGVLRVAFADLLPSEVDDATRHLLFSRADAERIWRFVLEHRSVARIVVHCDAGHSRSPAVAAAIATWLGQDTATFFSRHDPNPFVLALMNDTAPR